MVSFHGGVVSSLPVPAPGRRGERDNIIRIRGRGSVLTLSPRRLYYLLPGVDWVCAVNWSRSSGTCCPQRARALCYDLSCVGVGLVSHFRAPAFIIICLV